MDGDALLLNCAARHDQAEREAAGQHHFRQAVVAAAREIDLVAELAALAAGAADDAAGILGFQIALLEDDALSAPAFGAIEGGAPADVAWRESFNRGEYLGPRLFCCGHGLRTIAGHDPSGAAAAGC